MAHRSRQILVQMTLVLVIALSLAAFLILWKLDAASTFVFGDPRPLFLNGGILVLFLLGTFQLLRGVRHYGRQEDQIAAFIDLRQQGTRTAEALEQCPDPSLLRERHTMIRELYAGGGPIDHGALSAVMLASESLRLSFPRFVNNVLILTGVFGTVSSLIFALVGASDVLQNAVPGSGMGLLLLGMNTALTTTATAIVCYFFFTYFYSRYADLQTWVLSQLERAALLHMVPDFTFEPEALNHQTKLLVEDVRELVAEMREGMDGMAQAVARLDDSARNRHAQGERLVAGQEAQSVRLEASLEQLAELRRVLIEGFRLDL